MKENVHLQFQTEKPAAGCLFIHGLTGTPEVFNSLIKAFEAANICCVAPVLPGHGTKPSDLNAVTWQEWAACCKNAYKRLKLKCGSVFIVGHSFGGSIGLFLSANMAVDGLITISAPLKFGDKRLFLLPLLKIFIHSWKKKNVSSKSVEYDCYPLFAVEQGRIFLKMVRQCLCNIFCPVFIMHSINDKRLSYRNALEIYKKNHSGEKMLLLLTESGHTPVISNDAALLEKWMLDFIKKIENNN